MSEGRILFFPLPPASALGDEVIALCRAHFACAGRDERRRDRMTHTMQPMGIPSAPTGGVASRVFALRCDNGIAGRALPKGADS